MSIFFHFFSLQTILYILLLKYVLLNLYKIRGF